MPNSTTIVTVREVSLLLSGRRHSDNCKLTQISVIPFGHTEEARARTAACVIFPSYRLIKNLSRQYLGRDVSLDKGVKSHVTDHNSLRFNVAEGTTIKQRALFLAALAERTRMKK